MKQIYQNAKERHETMLEQKRAAVQLKDMGLKCVVTDYALAQWYAQSFKMDVNSKKQKSSGENTSDTAKWLRKFTTQDKRDIQEIELNEHIKKTRNRGFGNQSSELNDYSNENTKDPKEMMRRLKTVLYPATKDVKWFKETEEEFAQLRQDSEQKYAKRNRKNNQGADDSMSQSSYENNDATNRLNRSQKSFINRAGGTDSSDQKRKSKRHGNNLKVNAKLNADVGFESIQEEQKDDPSALSQRD